MAWTETDLGFGSSTFAGAATLPLAAAPLSTTSGQIQRGQVTLSDLATLVTVVLAPPQADTNYFIDLTPVVLVGSPAAAASQVVLVTKATGSFLVLVSVAPGTGNSVTFDWVLIR